jgi:hypothetical protein
VESSGTPSDNPRDSHKPGEAGGGHADASGDPSDRTRDRTSGEVRTHADRLRALGKKAAKDCPAGVTAVQCGTLVEAFAKGKRSHPHPVTKASDCLRVMSRENCEALLSAQKAAAEQSHDPVNVEDCMRNPTPRCEEVLKQVFEEQRAAE